MTPAAVLFELARGGIDVKLQGADLRIAPASALTPQARALIVSRKPEIVCLLSSAEQTTRALLAAIDATCNVRGDEPANREALRRECQDLAPHEQVDALEHFEQQARELGGWSGKPTSQGALPAHAPDDDRRTCSECKHGRASRCPDGAPLPADVRHRCPGFTDRGVGMSPARAANLRRVAIRQAGTWALAWHFGLSAEIRIEAVDSMRFCGSCDFERSGSPDVDRAILLAGAAAEALADIGLRYAPEAALLAAVRQRLTAAEVALAGPVGTLELRTAVNLIRQVWNELAQCADEQVALVESGDRQLAVVRAMVSA